MRLVILLLVTQIASAALPRPIPTTATKPQILAEIALLDGSVSSLNGQVSTLTATVNANAAIVTGLQVDVAACAVQVSDLTVTNAVLIVQAAELQAQILPLADKVALADALDALARSTEQQTLSDAYFAAYPVTP